MFQRFKRPFLWALVLITLSMMLFVVIYNTFKAAPIPEAPVSNMWKPQSLTQRYWVDEGENQVDILNITPIDHNNLADLGKLDPNHLAHLSLKLKFGRNHTQIGEANFIEDMIQTMLQTPSITASTSGPSTSINQWVAEHSGLLDVSYYDQSTIIDVQVHHKQLDLLIKHLFHSLSATAFDTIQQEPDYIDQITGFYQQYFHSDYLQLIVFSQYNAQHITDLVSVASQSLPKIYRELPTPQPQPIFDQLPIMQKLPSASNSQTFFMGFKFNATHYSSDITFLNIITQSLLSEVSLSVKHQLNQINQNINVQAKIITIDEKSALFGLSFDLPNSIEIDTINNLTILMSYFNSLKVDDFEKAYNQLFTHKQLTQSQFELTSPLQWIHLLNQQEPDHLSKVITSASLLPTFDQERFTALLNQFNADNLYVSIHSNKFEADQNLRLSSRLLSQLRTTSNEVFHFMDNPFDLSTSPTQNVPNQIESILYKTPPKKITQTLMSETQLPATLWFYKNATTPEYTQFNLRVQLLNYDQPKYQALGFLYTQYIQTQIQDLIWSAAQRDITLNIEYNVPHNAIDFSFSGPDEHSEKAWLALLNQLHQIKSSTTYLNNAKNVSIEKLKKTNTLKQYADEILINSKNSQTLIDEIESTSMNQLVEFSENLQFSNLLMYINNHHTSDKAISIFNKTSLNFKNKTTPTDQLTLNPTDALVNLNNQHHVFKIKSQNNYSSILSRIELDEAPYRASAIALLFNQLLSQKFEQLISDKNLSDLDQSISISAVQNFHAAYIDFYWASNQIDPALLNLHLEQIFSEPLPFLENLDTQSFEKFKSHLVYSLKQKSISPMSTANDHWQHIIKNSIHFNDSIRIATELENLSRDSFVRIIKTKILANNSKKLSIFDLSSNETLVNQYNENKQHLQGTTTLSSTEQLKQGE